MDSIERACPTCKGNDGDMPCAYPSEGMAGCLRDNRLAPTSKESLTIATDAPGTPVTADAPATDLVVETNVALMRSRSALGIKKYGVTLADSELPLRAFLVHALEESLDHANYLQAAMQKIYRAAAAPQQHAQAALSDMTTDEAREYLVKFMEQNFTDTTYHRYILSEPGRNGLAGDFAWQMARALRNIASQQPAAAPGAPATHPQDAAKECLQDIVSHHSDFRAACRYRRDACLKAGDNDNAAYWAKQINVLDRMSEQARAALAAIRALSAKPAEGKS